MDAWRRHPAFAQRMATRKHKDRPPRRRLRWQDRVLLLVGIFLRPDVSVWGRMTVAMLAAFAVHMTHLYMVLG